MRVGIDIKAFKNGTTGIARYLRSIMDKLQEIDTENEYILYECNESGYAPSNPKWRVVRTHWRLPGILWQQLYLPYLMARDAVDVLWSPEQVCPVFSPKGVRIITTFHDLAHIRFPEAFTRSTRLILTHSTPFVLRRSQKIGCNSDFTRKEILNRYGRFVRPENVSVVPCGGPDWEIPKKPPERQDFLFFAGNLEPRKNLLRVIKSLELLNREKKQNIPLHLAGPAGWKNTELHNLLAQSPIRPYIHLLGYVSEKKLIEKYLTCRALIYPSIYEGFGIPVLEALRMRCPILTSRGTVMEEIAGKMARYFDPFDVQSIAAAIEEEILVPTTFDENKRCEILSTYEWHRSAHVLLSLFHSQ